MLHAPASQVLTGIATTFDIPYPESYEELLKWLSTIELDFFQAMPMGCLVPMTFHITFLVRTLVPLICTDSSGSTTFTRNWIFRSSLHDSSASRRVFLSPDEIEAVYGQCQHEIIENIYCVYEKDAHLYLDEEDNEVLFFDKDYNGQKSSLLATTTEECDLERAMEDEEND